MPQQVWRVELLGHLVVRCGDRTITRFKTRQAAALLARLACCQERAHRREELAEMLWPEEDPAATRVRLRQAISQLRRVLEAEEIPPEPVLLADRLELRLAPGAVATDVAEFEEALGSARRAPAGSRLRAELLDTAVTRYHGPLLPGFFESWIVPEQHRLEELFQAALQERIALCTEAGDWDRALDCARRAAAADPLREEAHQQLIGLLMQTGRIAESHRCYRDLERLLGREFGVSPSPATRRLLQQPVSSSTLQRGFPPLQAEAVFRSNLPQPLTRFFGREEEIAQLQSLLRSKQTRLVTLTGPGGTGKTRLALEVAAGLTERFAGAVWFVSLADLSDAGLLAGAVADALRLPRHQTGEPLEQVAEFLGRHPALLVLDNFEHLVEEGAPLVRLLLERLPQLCCLVTSRQSLEIAGESEAPVAPLEVPLAAATPERLLEFASVQLLADRVRAVRSDFRVTAQNAGDVAALAARLEGIPLAIELAAAWAAMLTPAQMSERLSHRFDLLIGRHRDAPARHRSLRAALDSSFVTLEPELQRHFAALCVFRGGWSLEAAEALFEAPALDTLRQLRSRSLILAEENRHRMRYRMLETVREFAAEQLDAEGDRVMRARHAAYLTAMVETARKHLTGAQQIAWIERLEDDHDNLRAAMEWTLRNDPPTAVRLIGAVWRFWWLRGHLQEARQWLVAALARRAVPPQTSDLRVLVGAATIAIALGDTDAARGYASETLALAHAMNDLEGIGSAAGQFGLLAFFDGELDQAAARFSEALENYRASAEWYGTAMSLLCLGLVCLAQGRLEAAREALGQAGDLLHRNGETISAALAEIFLGFADLANGELSAAQGRFIAGLLAFRQLDPRMEQAMARVCEGFVTLAQQGLPAARLLFTEGLDLLREAGSQGGMATILIQRGCEALLEAG